MTMTLEYLKSILAENKQTIKDLLYKYVIYGNNLKQISDMMYNIRVLEDLIAETQTRHDNEIQDIATSITDINILLKELKSAGTQL